MVNKPTYEQLQKRVQELETALRHSERERTTILDLKPDHCLIQEDLGDNEKRLQEFFERAPVGIFQSTPEGKYLQINTRFADMLGYTQSELMQVGNIADLYVDPNHREEVKHRLAEYDKLEGFNIHLRRKDGGTMWMSIYVHTRRDEQGRIRFYDGFTLDITERKEAEEALRESEEKYRVLVEHANDAIFVAQDKVIKFPNPKTERILGYSRKELSRTPFTDFIHPEDRQMVLTRHTQRLSGDAELPGTYSFRIVNKHGRETWGQLNTVLIDWEGRPATLNFLRDITEQKELESQLQQAQKMEAVGTLAGGIAHDFNNILTPVIIQTELALLNASDNGLRNSLQEVLEAGHRAKSLVKQILAFSRQVKVECVPLRMGSIVKEALKMLRATLPTTIRIEQNLRAETGTVRADPTQIHQVLMNLCTNAAHAMKEKGGILKVSLEETFIQAGDKGNAVLPGKYLRLSVGDTGHGMDESVSERIFEPFFTTKDRSEGTGMGLSVVHGIVANYGGTIDVETEVGKGTVFHVFFPEAEQANVREPVKPAGELPGGEEQILVVDDEKPTVDSLVSMLTHLGYQVTSRTSSIEALEAFRAQPDEFDLVITDQTMPNMRGDELAEKLIGMRSDIPIILCTGFSESISQEQAKALGIREFVMKPIIMQEMAATIRKMISPKGEEN